jgi:hypothetical protein
MTLRRMNRHPVDRDLLILRILNEYVEASHRAVLAVSTSKVGPELGQLFRDLLLLLVVWVADYRGGFGHSANPGQSL